jgi:hypothetical protein
MLLFKSLRSHDLSLNTSLFRDLWDPVSQVECCVRKGRQYRTHLRNGAPKLPILVAPLLLAILYAYSTHTVIFLVDLGAVSMGNRTNSFFPKFLAGKDLFYCYNIGCSSIATGVKIDQEFTPRSIMRNL